MLRDKFLMLIALLYVVSLFLPGILISGQYGQQYPYHGYLILIFGWLGIVDWSFAWLANPLVWFVLFRFHSEKTSVTLVASITALCLGLTAFLMQTSRNFETGHSDLVHLTTGYYIWIGAITLLTFYSLFKFMRTRTNRDLQTKSKGGGEMPE